MNPTQNVLTPDLAPGTPLDARHTQVRLFLPKVVIGSVFVLSVVRLIHLTDRYAVNVLFRDQWKFDEATLFEQHSMLEIFRWQHGPHRQGLGGVLSKLLEPMIGWNSRYEAFGIVAILSLTALLALWLKERLTAEVGYADIIIPLIFLTPVQYQVIFEGANPSHGPIPVLLLVVYGLVWTLEDQRIRWTLALITNLLLVYTGFGIFIGAVTPLLLAHEYRRTRSRALPVLIAIALLSFVSFFIGYKFNPAADCFSPKPGNPFYYALFAGFMLSSFVGIQPVSHLLAAILTGLVLLGALLWISSRVAARFWREGGSIRLVTFALMTYSLLFLISTAYGRICLGLAAAQASRYTCYTAVAFFAVYLAAKAAKSRAGVFAVFILAVMSAAGLSRWDKTQIAQVSEGRRNWRDCYLAYRDVALCDQKSGTTIYWAPEPPDLQGKLSILEARHLNLFSEETHKIGSKN